MPTKWAMFEAIVRSATPSTGIAYTEF